MPSGHPLGTVNDTISRAPRRLSQAPYGPASIQSSALLRIPNPRLETRDSKLEIPLRRRKRLLGRGARRKTEDFKGLQRSRQPVLDA
jgi:hypothetical protein